MKSTYKLLILFGFIVMGSCELNEEPYGFYSKDNFYKTPGDAEAAISYAYDALTFLEYSRAIFYVGDFPTDEAFPKSDEGIDGVGLVNWDVANFKTNGMLKNFFKYAYIAINRSNSVLDNIPNAEFSEELKNKYLGEAYFLRAWNYFNLARNFGLVPIHTTTVVTLEQTSAPMASSLDEVYDLILADCRKAIELLDIERGLGRADKVAAQSLAAKVYLTIASSKENNVPVFNSMSRDVTTMYDSAAFFAREVVLNQSEYGFDDNLLSIYDVEKPLGKEHIFLMSMDRSGADEGDYSKISKLFIPYIAGGDIYLDNANGTYTKSHDGWSVFQTRADFYDSFEGADLRKTLLLVDKVYNQAGDVIAEYPTNMDYPFSRKYIDPLFIDDKTSTKPFLIRFSDIALVFAEAVGPTTEGYAAVNYIRNRAGLGDLPGGLSENQFRESILEERKYELAFEGNRLYDLRRFNKVAEVVPAAAGLSAEQVTFYPIPQSELDLNQGL